MNDDFLQKFMFEDLPVKGGFVRLASSWQTVLQRAQPDPSVHDMLGQTLCAAALLTCNIKFRGNVSLQIQSAGPVRLMLGQCSHDGLVRGVARMNEADSADAVQRRSVLAINLEPEDEGAPYQGIVALDDAGLVPTLERYFYQSEQLETRFWLVANDSQCSGLMLQRMPGEQGNFDDWNRITQLAATLTDQELQTLEPERLFHLLFQEDSIRLFPPLPVRFSCKCSKQKVASVLVSLGQPEIEGIIDERGVVEVDCQYCGQQYLFDAVDVAALFAEQVIPPGGSREVH